MEAYEFIPALFDANRFTDTGHWLFFLNLEHFTKTLMDSEARLSIQPALIYAGLAMATLMKSSEAEFKAPGRERALWLRDNAAKLIQNSIESEWIDASLAEAALIIALFETSAHPMYNPDRVEQALLTLDFIIRTTSLTTIDSSDPDVLIYPVGCVPMTDPPAEWNHSSDRKCTCLPEPSDAPHAHIAQYALLFPGEALDRMSPTYRSSTSSTKESVWALYCRSMLLWNFTNQLRMTVLPDDEKVELIYDAWSEAQSLQDSLRMHTCNLDTVLIYMSREYVYKLQGLGNGPPIFKRKQAEEWCE
ncbi:hypothetical protein C0989_006524 [Termitomyces sp. Mn162]|nr:hypothetical protein C0989_006524 [Termitomyces sp. Mn162]